MFLGFEISQLSVIVGVFVLGWVYLILTLAGNLSGGYGVCVCAQGLKIQAHKISCRKILCTKYLVCSTHKDHNCNPNINPKLEKNDDSQ